MSDIGKLAEGLAAAQTEHAAAKVRTSVARNEENNALNRLNAAQKKIDEAYTALRKGADRDSGWARDQMPGVADG